MKVGGVLYSLFGIFMLFICLIIFRNTIVDADNQFEELRLRYAVDYATEAAFRQCLGVDDIGTDYVDIDNVTINPSLAMETFESILCLSYDMSLGEENFRHIENCVPAAILMCNDGYYLCSMTETDNDYLPTQGGEYDMRWSVKYPYTVEIGKYLYSVNLYTKQWTSVSYNAAGGVDIETGNTFMRTGATGLPVPTGLTRDIIKREISKQVTAGVNYVISERNKLNTSYGEVGSFFLPTEWNVNGINAPTKPTLMFIVQGVDFAGSQRLDAVSIGGVRVERKRVVAAFVDETGQKYYCYERQLPVDKLDSVVEFYEHMEDAAADGYRPHYEYLGNAMRD